MAIHLVPARTDNLTTSIDNPISESIVERHLEKNDYNQLKSVMDGDIFCFAVAENMSHKFHGKYAPGDLVLFSESGKKKFTRLGVVASFTTNRNLGEEIWPFSGKSPWSHIYFLQHIRKIDIDKAKILEALNMPPTTPISWPERLEENSPSITEFKLRHGVPFFEWIDIQMNKQNESSSGISFQLATTRQRIGQHTFRSETLTIYKFKCSISGCGVTSVLQAAHIIGVTELDGSHSAENSLLLRADLHLLFDQHYLYIEPKSLRAKFHPALHRNFPDSINDYGKYENQPISHPNEGIPSKKLLARHKARCIAAHGEL
ncbi:hypothetical protein EA187_20050 [Lujinxingia sediminis]|uniref:HNH nuclease domain-containing protein n=1 Tax=Lujinxingia sediminis TaxID=2480984 RepID=A0ABY0CML1_9DELT|nr:HNH endonuclease [Lujinxingia sediminis]RVU40404.1 hypothetical protein EA187_20050 [Lujinxingia sediminis]